MPLQVKYQMRAIGQALIGKKTGDTATIETPAGSYDVKILKVEKTV